MAGNNLVRLASYIPLVSPCCNIVPTFTYICDSVDVNFLMSSSLLSFVDLLLETVSMVGLDNYIP